MQKDQDETDMTHSRQEAETCGTFGRSRSCVSDCKYCAEIQVATLDSLCCDLGEPAGPAALQVAFH